MYAEKQKIYGDLVALSPTGRTLVAYFRDDQIIKIYKLFNKGFELNKTIPSSSFINNIAVTDSLVAAVNSLRRKVYIHRKKNNQWIKQELDIPDVYFGIDFSIAVGNDRIFVGVQNTRRNGSSGTVYIFAERDNSWRQEEIITVADGEATGCFGYSMTFGNNTLAIGDWESNDSKGLVYIFRYVDGTWKEEAKIKAPDGAASDFFGKAVKINSKGDVVVVGARGARNSKGLDSGCAYVFTRNKDVWTYQAKLTASDGKDDDQFGSSVTISNDSSVILVGAHCDSSKSKYSGSAYVFIFDGGAWVEQEKLTSEDAEDYDLFGSYVFISSNNTFVIGANGRNDRKLAYIFSG